MEYNRHYITMKKILFSIIALIVVATSGIANATSYEIAKDTSSEIALSGYSVTVWWIRNSGNMWIKTRKTGTYNSDEGTLSIGSSTYQVKDNPYYGDDDSHGRGAYRYVAGGQYYFNN